MSRKKLLSCRENKIICMILKLRLFFSREVIERLLNLTKKLFKIKVLFSSLLSFIVIFHQRKKPMLHNFSSLFIYLM